MIYSLLFSLSITLILAFSCTDTLAADDSKQLIINADMQYDYAEKLYNSGDYETAVIEFKRAVYFFPQDKRAGHARFNTGKALFNLKRFKSAAFVFKSLCHPYTGDEINIESFFMQSFAWLALQNKGAAQTVLHNLMLLTEDKNVKDRIYSTLAWIYIENSEYMARADNINDKNLVRALNYIEKISEPNREKYRTNELRTRVNTLMMQKKKSPHIAGFASIIPGGGFLYCERPRDATVSFLFNSALILAAVKAFNNGNYALGSLITFVEAGFYIGNIYGGISSAHKYNRFKRKNFLELIKKEFQFQEQSIFNSETGYIPMFPDVSHEENQGRYLSLLNFKWRF